MLTAHSPPAVDALLFNTTATLRHKHYSYSRGEEMKLGICHAVSKWLSEDSSPGLSGSKAEFAWFRGHSLIDMFWGVCMVFSNNVGKWLTSKIGRYHIQIWTAGSSGGFR